MGKGKEGEEEEGWDRGGGVQMQTGTMPSFDDHASFALFAPPFAPSTATAALLPLLLLLLLSVGATHVCLSACLSVCLRGGGGLQKAEAVEGGGIRRRGGVGGGAQRQTGTIPSVDDYASFSPLCRTLCCYLLLLTVGAAHVCLSACLPVCLPACLRTCLVCLFVCCLWVIPMPDSVVLLKV